MKKALPIVVGMIGAALGFVAVMLLAGAADLAVAADPIESGLLVLFVLAPIGAIAGLVLGTALGMRLRGEGGGSLARNSLKAFGATVAAAAVAGTAVAVAMISTATPWLNPNAANPLLLFEVRFPAGVVLPADAAGIKVELQTDLNQMPGALSRIGREADQPVIAGAVELAFRTANRQLAIKMAGHPERIYRIALTGKAPHARALGPWQRLSDGSEIRYRAQWPGQD